MKTVSLAVTGVVLAAVLLSAEEASAVSLLGDTFDQIDFFGNSAPVLADSEWGRYTATVATDSSLNFLNVVVQDTSGQAVWAVRNLTIPPDSLQPDPVTIYTAFDLRPFGIERGIDALALSVYREFSVLPLTAPPTPTYSTVPVGAVQHDAEGKAGTGGPHTDPGVPVMNTIAELFGGVTDFVWRNMPSVEQGVDECGPSAAANSLEWLGKEYKIKLDDSLTDRRDAIKDATHMKTNLGKSGTTDADFIDGKLRYLDEKGLDWLDVKFMDDALGGGDRTVGDAVARAKGTTPTAEFILGEINRGEDVEIGFTYVRPEKLVNDVNGNGWADPGDTYLDENGNGRWDPEITDGGHWVTAAGKIELLSGLLQGVWFVEDTKQGNDAAGTKDALGRTTYGFSWLDTRPDGFLELYNYPSRNKIDIVVSESVPEPSSLGLLLAAVAGLAASCSKRRAMGRG